MNRFDISGQAVAVAQAQGVGRAFWIADGRLVKLAVPFGNFELAQLDCAQPLMHEANAAAFTDKAVGVDPLLHEHAIDQ